jgi:hypothetical protein
MSIKDLNRRGVTVALAALVLAALAAGPASAQYYGGDNTIRFRAGLFEPEGDSEYWDDAEALFTGDASELEDTVFGIDYRRDLDPAGRFSLLVSASAYEGEDRREDRFFVDNLGFPIEHDVLLTIAPFTAGVNFNLLPQGPVRPYVGAGGGFYVWELEETGDFVFGDDIFFESFLDEGGTFGYYYLAGIEVPVGPSFALFAEGRWHNAEDELSDDFEDFGDLDLSGREITGGISWTF